MIKKVSLMQRITKATKLPLREASACIDVIFDTMADAISRGERIELRGFGSFYVRKVAAKKTAFVDGVIGAHNIFCVKRKIS